jgi:hypothetical protein
MDRKQIYSVVNAQYAIYCHSDYGPNFGGHALSVLGDPLNKEDGGYC